MSEFEAAGSCLNDDVLVTLSVALGPGATPTLTHLSACATCLARLQDVERLRRALASEEPVRSGFAEEVVRALEAAGPLPATALPTVADRRSLRGIAVLNPILAAAATLFLILPAGGGSVLPRSALIVSGLVGLGVLLWNSLGRRIVPGL